MVKNFIEMNYGEEGTVLEITEFSRELNDFGIYKGKKIRMMTKLPVRNNVIVSTKRCRIIISPEMASGIIVEPDIEMEFE